MTHIAGDDRSQAVLLPDVLDDYVGPAHPVRFLDAFVAQLDLGGLGFQRATPAETGRPGYHPGDLLRRPVAPRRSDSNSQPTPIAASNAFSHRLRLQPTKGRRASRKVGGRASRLRS